MNPAKITSTIGLNIGQIGCDGVTLSFWDLGGQQELQSLWDKYYEESHGLIYVVDSNDRGRMEESQQIFDTMIGNEHLKGIPLLILANKQDLPECMGVREIKPVFQQAGDHIGRRDCLIMPVSALTGYIFFRWTFAAQVNLIQLFLFPHREGVDEGIKWLVDAVVRNSPIRPAKEKDEF